MTTENTYLEGDSTIGRHVIVFSGPGHTDRVVW